jgi:hypothetical protein
MYIHETAKPWKCDLCNFSHSLKKGLDGHKRACHTDESNLKVCHICGYKSATNQTMRMHIEAKHEKKRDFACNVCDAKFYRRFKLDLHVRGIYSLFSFFKVFPEKGFIYFINQTFLVILNSLHEFVAGRPITGSSASRKFMKEFLS